jgi:hypothetical protein
METINIHPITSKYGQVDFHIWQDDAGDWYSCRSGEYRGITSESDDLGPFDSKAAAIDAQWQDWNAYIEQEQ